MRRMIVLSGERYFDIINNIFGREITNTEYIDSICIVKNKYGFISYTFFHYDKKRRIIIDIRKQLTDKEVNKLLVLINIMGTKEALNTLF